MKGMKVRGWSLGFALAATLAMSQPMQSRANIVVTAEDPGVQSSQVAGVTTEDFNGFPIGSGYTVMSTAVGQVTSPGAAIVAPDAFGGSDATRYFSIGAQSGFTTATLALGQDRAYFGFFWGAGDRFNELKFYHQGNLIFDFKTSDVIDFLATLSNKDDYYGNPNNGQDASEPFVYLNFFGQGGTVFDKVEFFNPTTGTGFETDNWSVLTDETPPTGTPINTPEPSAAVIAGLGALGMLVGARRMRTRAAC